MPKIDPPYRGRFAPSPTGPLHLGSLIAALASYLDARYHRGRWLVRMEDLDPPREQAGAARQILHSLHHHGLHCDDTVVCQSTRSEAYTQALQTLQADGHVFNCDCTRQTLGPGGSCRGQCRQRQGQLKAPTATRVTVPPACHIRFEDQIQGWQDALLGSTTPDFILRRKDGLDAYQLAVVVDDAWQGITHIVRGSALLDSTPRQIFLQQLLGHSTPTYSHIPVITDARGQKFSKQNHAPALDNSAAPDNLRAALRFLHQEEPPAALDSTAHILEFAAHRWAAKKIPRVRAAAATHSA